jgi:monothiol glutaredoxin
MPNISEKIQQTISSNDVVVYIKGTKDFPQCGFSAAVIHTLRTIGVNFVDVDVLSDPEIRRGIKEFSDWPTIPQLYIKGHFIGGCDIVKEMFQSGELQDLLKASKLI